MFYCPLTCNSASDWKVPTTFIYGQEDWMNYQGAQQARKDMKVPCEIIRVPQVNFSCWQCCIVTNCNFTILVQGLNFRGHVLQGGHFVFIDNPSGFHSAVFYACRNHGEEGFTFPDGLISAWSGMFNNLVLPKNSLYEGKIYDGGNLCSFPPIWKYLCPRPPICLYTDHAVCIFCDDCKKHNVLTLCNVCTILYMIFELQYARTIFFQWFSVLASNAESTSPFLQTVWYWRGHLARVSLILFKKLVFYSCQMVFYKVSKNCCAK